MAYFRKCERCNCTLDPGEGRLCSECETEEKLRLERAEEVKKFLQEDENGQVQLKEINKHDQIKIITT